MNNAGTKTFAPVAVTASVATSTSASLPEKTQRYAVVPAQRDKRIDVIENFSPAKATNFTAHTLQQRFNIEIPVTELAAFGTRIPFTTESGLLSKDDFIYSTELEATADSLDFPTRVAVELDHDTNLPLKVTTAMRALENERGMADPSTVDPATNPYGMIQLTIPRGSKTASYERNVTPQHLNYIAACPGQTASNISNWLLFPPHKSDTVLMTMNPLPAIASHYNALVAEKNDKSDTAQYTPIDLDNIDSIITEQGDCHIYVNKDLALEALKRTQAAHTSKLNYCNFTNERELGFHLVSDTTKTVKNGRVNQTATRFSDALRSTEVYAQAAARDAKAADRYINQGKHSFSGTMTYTFIRADKNFQLSPIKD